MLIVILVIVLAVIEVMTLDFLVALGREQHGVPAPASSGPWERLNRTYQNSLEQLVLFIPLFLAYCFNTGLHTGIVLGLVYLIARIVYAVGSMRDPERRAAGAFLTFAVQVWLAVGAVIGLVVKIARS